VLQETASSSGSNLLSDMFAPTEVLLIFEPGSKTAPLV